MGAKRAVPLPVSAPFHCPLMQPAADAMAEALGKTDDRAAALCRSTPMSPPQPVADPAEIRGQLVEQVTGMVRWRESIANMAAAGVEEFVELGGKVLGPMVKRIAPDAKVTSVVTIEDIEARVAEGDSHDVRLFAGMTALGDRVRRGRAWQRDRQGAGRAGRAAGAVGLQAGQARGVRRGTWAAIM